MQRRLFLSVIAGVVVFLSACGDEDNAAGPGGGSTGRVTVELMDAPFPFDLVESAVVTMDSLDIQVATDNPALSGFATLTTEQRIVDLLELQNGVTETLVSTEIPTGQINQLRLFVSAASVSLADGRIFDLEIPSGAQTGIKAFPSPAIQVVGTLTSELLLDFDVSQSFLPVPDGPTEASQVQRFLFHPSLRVINESETGTLSGVVQSDAGTPDNPSDDTSIAGASVTAFLDGQEITATSTDAQGGYKLMGLPEGTYALMASATNFAPDSLGATVVVGNDIGENDFLLSPADQGGESSP